MTAYGSPLVIAVEGNIGSGKSTFLSYCETKSYIEVYPEPLDKWRNVKGDNLLVRNMTLGKTEYILLTFFAG